VSDAHSQAVRPEKHQQDISRRAARLRLTWEECLAVPVHGGRLQKSRPEEESPLHNEERIPNICALGQTRALFELIAFLRYRTFNARIGQSAWLNCLMQPAAL
jgi:hypothetical protein